MRRAVLRAVFGASLSAIAACGGSVQDGNSAAGAASATGGMDASMTGGGGAKSSGGAGGVAGQIGSDGNTKCVPAYQAYQGCLTTDECCPATSSSEIVCYVPPGTPPPPDDGQVYFAPGRCTDPPVRLDGSSCTPTMYPCQADSECCSSICGAHGDGGSGICERPGCTRIGLPCAANSDCCNLTGCVACNAGICSQVSCLGH